MSYEPTNWVNGETPINADNLNKIEQELVNLGKKLADVDIDYSQTDLISDKYSYSKTYAVGDYCIQDDILYKCITAVGTAEEFDSSKWEVTTVVKEIDSIKSTLGDQVTFTLDGTTLRITSK